MATKINSNSFLDIMKVLYDDIKTRGIVYLESDDEQFNGRHLKIEGRQHLNFGTCGYLGLETDPRLINKSIEAVKNFGTQYSVSRGYVTSGINIELENLLKKMYNKPLLVYSSTSLAHVSVLPIVVSGNDAIILDQSVHISIQTTSQLLRQKGVPIEMIRHSNMEMLEHAINRLGPSYEKIWYMIDGVYSMYGDLPPLDEITALMEKYPQLHIYSDDAHGMSWYGKNGCGHIFDKIGVPERTILITTLAKGFGSLGGLAIFPNQEILNDVKIYGGPLSYSHPLAPAVIGAGIASAEIHLSPEIYKLQNELKAKLDYTNQLLSETNIPVISDPQTPIYYLGVGQPKVGFNLLKRMLEKGFFINIGIFPTVPIKNTGIRFTINNHLNFEDIQSLITTLHHNYNAALKDEGITNAQVRKSFRLPLEKESTNIEHSPIAQIKERNKYKLEHYTTINSVNEKEWNSIFANEGVFDHNALQFLEESFSGNYLPEDNWRFHYFFIKDENDKILLATFLTIGIYKDDMLAAPEISEQLDLKRKSEPYHFTSVSLGLGSLYTLGNHMYFDKSYSNWKEVFKLFLFEIEKLQESEQVSNTYLRDFDNTDAELFTFLLEEGFFKINVPNHNVVENVNWKNTDEYLAQLSKRNKRHVKYEILKHEDQFDVVIKDELTDEETENLYMMYLNVRKKNFAVNFFPYAKKSFYMLSKYPNWEIIVLRLKNEINSDQPVVAYCVCYKNENAYNFEVIGMDYDYVYKYNVYKQALYQVVKRAAALNKEKIYMGLTSDLEKKKVGAKQVEKVAYVQTKDNYNFEVIESMAIITEKTPV